MLSFYIYAFIYPLYKKKICDKKSKYVILYHLLKKGDLTK